MQRVRNLSSSMRSDSSFSMVLDSSLMGSDSALVPAGSFSMRSDSSLVRSDRFSMLSHCLSFLNFGSSFLTRIIHQPQKSTKESTFDVRTTPEQAHHRIIRLRNQAHLVVLALHQSVE
jgi:hypothetical protein